MNIPSNQSYTSLLSDIEFLLHLVPEWVKRVPKGLDSTFYGTLTYEGDVLVKERYDRLVKLVSKRSTLEEIE